jgi:hypothetical protein
MPRCVAIPPAVTSNGRAEVPRKTSTAWVAVLNADLVTPITRMCVRAQAGPAGRVEIGVAVDHQQAQPNRARCSAAAGALLRSAADVSGDTRLSVDASRL